MSILTALKNISTLKREKSNSIAQYNYNNSVIEFLENKRVQTGRDTKEIINRKEMKKQYADDLFYAEKMIDNILIEVPRLHLIGYNVQPI